MFSLLCSKLLLSSLFNAFYENSQDKVWSNVQAFSPETSLKLRFFVWVWSHSCSSFKLGTIREFYFARRLEWNISDYWVAKTMIHSWWIVTKVYQILAISRERIMNLLTSVRWLDYNEVSFKRVSLELLDPWLSFHQNQKNKCSSLLFIFIFSTC